MVVLLVEDDFALAELVIEYLENADFDCDHAFSGPQALELLQDNSYDVVVLDVNLPGCDGLEVCRELRANGIATPVIMLTARDKLEDKLSGFAQGADDYLVKPFDMPELSARIKALSVRHKHQAVIKVGDLEVVPLEHRASRCGKTLKLSPDEWKLLLYLAQRSPQVAKKQELEDLLWPDEEVSADALKMSVYRLRKAIDVSGEKPLLHTVRGVGISLREES